jgi:hypothetical protein
MKLDSAGIGRKLNLDVCLLTTHEIPVALDFINVYNIIYLIHVLQERQ